MKQKMTKRILAMLLAAVFAVALLPGVAVFAEESGQEAQATTAPKPTEAPVDTTKIISDLEGGGWLATGYRAYLASHSGVARLPRGTEVAVNAKNFVEATEGANATVLDSYEGVSDVIEWKNGGKLTYDVNVPVTGLYNIKVQYYPTKTMSKPLILSAMVNGARPYMESESMQLLVDWVDELVPSTDKEGNEIAGQWSMPVDRNKNDIRPQQHEEYRWMTQDLRDPEGLYTRLFFYLEKGENQITLECQRGELQLGNITLYQYEDPAPYAEVYAEESAKPNQVPADFITRIQAEKPLHKSDPSLFPVFDRSSIMTDPSDYQKLRLNTMGGVAWAGAFQSLTYEFDAPADGFYKIAFKARQNLLLGMFTTRKLTIDGEVPFLEAAALKFQYQAGWYLQTPEVEGEDCLFYFTKGRHEIAMEVEFGDASSTIGELKDSVYMLNAVYRRIIMIMGTVRDPFRDYELDKEIPGLIGTLLMITEKLEAEAARLQKLTGRVGGEAQVINRMTEQMQDFIKDPDKLPMRVTNFKSNIDSLGAWIMRLQQQSLELDYIEIAAPDQALGKMAAPWYASFWYNVRIFIASFYEDYNMFEEAEVGARSVNVWIYGGRDQAQIVKGLIDNDFKTKFPDINISLKLVQADIITAIVAGKGPDISMSMGRGIPVNMAMRGALKPLDTMPGFDEVKTRFKDDAFVPYTYEGHVYGIPVTTNFYVMFYRTDIFESMGLTPPQTWDDLGKIIPILHQNNMQMGLPYAGMDAYQLLNGGMGSRNIFPALLYQRGGSFYTEDHTGTRLTDQVAVEAFISWTEFYTKYGFNQYYDFYNRFRSGEMPIGISDYGTFNQLSAAAPEIRGMWEMTLIPGTVQTDAEGNPILDAEGNPVISYAEAASGSAAGITKSCKAENVDSAWEFIKWWTSAETQLAYGTEIENLLGTAARYQPAAREAFENLPWSKTEKEVLLAQWENIIEIPEIPGGYITPRCLDNAFRSVINKYENPREMLFMYDRMINDEIQRKRKEFGLPTDSQ